MENQIPRRRATRYSTLAAFAKYSCRHGTWIIARGNKTKGTRYDIGNSHRCHGYCGDDHQYYRHIDQYPAIL